MYLLLQMKQRQNKIILNKIIRQIKHLREKKKISQEDFYNDTNIHIARIESGKANITISTLSDICSYFEISLSDFFKQLGE